MNEVIRNQIEALRTQPMKRLKQRYRELFGEDSPSCNQAHLFRRIAWRLQAMSEGDLSDRARGRAAELAVDFDLRLRAPRSFWEELESQPSGRDDRLPPAGTILEREFQGHLLRVKVLADGFEYKGRTYSSLSSIAYKVTGTRWNGFSFFGLTGERSQ
ncbi:MAG: DUF2924 domain-containing protein [Bryobacteraceae bacterium]|nr:DUF2924 domain-containing protein [Bryobacteraceae bacterium]